MPIPVACQCGQRFAAQDALAGKKVKCPACGGVILIPPPQQVQRPQPAQQAGGGFDMDDLSQFESVPAPGPNPLGTPASSPLGAPAGGAGFGSPLGGSQFGAPQGGWQNQYAQQQPAKSGMSKGLLFSLIGGGAALVVGVVVLVLVLALSGGGDDPQVADNSDDSTAANSTPVTTTPTNPGSNPTTTVPATTPSTDIGQVPGAFPGNTTTPVPGSTIPGESTVSQNSVIAPEDSTRRSGDFANLHGDSGGNNVAPKPASKSLNSAAIAWYANPDSNLRGVTKIKTQEDLPVFYDYSWMFELLPYLGYNELHGKIKSDQPWHRDPNRILANVIVPEFLNPADDRRVFEGYAFRGMGLTHFVGMSGIEDTRNVVAGRLPRSDPRAGVFGYDAVAQANEITDGASNTIMIIGSGEVVGCWIQGGGATIRGAREPYFDKRSGFGLRGMAKQGTLVMMADGSIRSIAADIDTSVFRAMCTIHGAETIDSSHLGTALNSFSVKSVE